MDYLPSSDKMGRAATTAVFAGSLSRAMNPAASVPVMGQMYPLWAVSSGAGAGASLASDYMFEIAIPQLDKELWMEETGGTLLTLGAGGAGYAGAVEMLDRRMLSELGGGWRVAATGAACVGAGHYVWGKSPRRWWNNIYVPSTT